MYYPPNGQKPSDTPTSPPPSFFVVISVFVCIVGGGLSLLWLLTDGYKKIAKVVMRLYRQRDAAHADPPLATVSCQPKEVPTVGEKLEQLEEDLKRQQ